MTEQPARYIPRVFVAHEALFDPRAHGIDRPKQGLLTCRRCIECRDGIRVPLYSECLIVTSLLYVGLLCLIWRLSASPK